MCQGGDFTAGDGTGEPPPPPPAFARTVTGLVIPSVGCSGWRVSALVVVFADTQQAHTHPPFYL